MESNEVVKELKAIKFILYICAILLIEMVVQPLLGPAPSWESILQKEQPKEQPIPKNKLPSEKKFIWSVSEVRDELNKGHLDTVIKMSTKRIAEFPNDSEPFWYRARAYGMKKQYKEGLKDLDQVERFSPEWKESYVEPLRRAFLNNMRGEGSE